MLTLEEIRNDETKNIEFKEMIPQDFKKFLKTVSAYSNCAGGKIIFGIVDGTLDVIGIKEDIHKAIDRLTNIIADSITPQLIPNIYVELMEHWETGIKRVLKLCKEAGIREPEFIDFGDALRVNIYRPSYENKIIVQDNLVSDQDNLVSDQQNDELSEVNIIHFCTQPKSMKELMAHFNFKHRTYFVNNYIKPLLESNKLGLTIPDKTNSRNQKYISKLNINSNK